jgi:hypothetical protein
VYWLFTYSPPQPDDQENNSDNEQYPEDRACQEMKKETQQPQNQDNDGNNHEQINHIVLPLLIGIYRCILTV